MVILQCDTYDIVLFLHDLMVGDIETDDRLRHGNLLGIRVVLTQVQPGRVTLIVNAIIT